jgi:hypothetical protein
MTNPVAQFSAALPATQPAGGAFFCLSRWSIAGFDAIPGFWRARVALILRLFQEVRPLLRRAIRDPSFGRFLQRF